MSNEKLYLLMIPSENKALKRNRKLIGLNYCFNRKNFQANNRRFKKLFVFIFFGLLSINHLSAQPSTQEPNWTYDTMVSGVEFYHAIVDCNGKKVVFLKFNNKNNSKVAVTWKEVFTTQAKLKQDGFSGQKKLTLSKGETFASDCNENTNRNCLILPRDVSPAYAVEIRKFEFKDILVSTN